MLEHGLNVSGSEEVPVEGFCEHGNENSGPTRQGNVSTRRAIIASFEALLNTKLRGRFNQ
jgi:hypothetical protein